MDVRVFDAAGDNVQQLSVVESQSSSDFYLNVDALNALIEYNREHNPRFKRLPESRIAEICDVSVTTFKDIRKGRCRKPRIDILYSIVAAFGGSIDRLIGLAPLRDFAREQAAWDATLVDGYRQRISYLEAQKAADDAEIARLHTLILDKAEAASRAESHAADLQERLNQLLAEAARHNAELRRLRCAALAAIALTLALISYVI